MTIGKVISIVDRIKKEPEKLEPENRYFDFRSGWAFNKRYKLLQFIVYYDIDFSEPRDFILKYSSRSAYGELFLKKTAKEKIIKQFKNIDLKVNDQNNKICFAWINKNSLYLIVSSDKTDMRSKHYFTLKEENLNIIFKDKYSYVKHFLRIKDDKIS